MFSLKRKGNDMNYDQYQARAGVQAAGASAVDAGLQKYMRGVYNTMGIGLVVTGLVAAFVASSESLIGLIYGTPLKWVVMFAPLAFILFGFTPGRMARMPVGQLRGLFYGFCTLMGLSMSYIFLAYTGASIAKTFFITAGMFAGVSLWGYTTKRDLTGMGSFMFMGMIGLVIASIVNIFLGSPALEFAISAIGIVVFTGLAAWETQRLKEVYAYGGGEANDRMAVAGALGLYLSFVNLFQFLLQFMGNRE